jgi:hypothetical protein
VTAFLLVATQHGASADRFFADALTLARSGTPVTVFLASDAVAAAGRSASPALADFLAAGGRVLVDEFTLSQRALTGVPLPEGSAVTDMVRVAEMITSDSTTVVWH